VRTGKFTPPPAGAEVEPAAGRASGYAAAGNADQTGSAELPGLGTPAAGDRLKGRGSHRRRQPIR